MKLGAPTEEAVKSHRTVESVEEVDFKCFEVFITAHYNKSWEESHRMLRAEIRKRFHCKKMKDKYRSALISDIDDLITTVVLRFTRINSKSQAVGGIKDFNAMLCTITNHVYHEELRRILRQAATHQLDDPETPELAAEVSAIDRELEGRDEIELENSCYLECLQKLPEHILNIFFRYYETENLTPGQREEKRCNLALELAGLAVEEATPQQIKRAKNNLDSLISKWRNTRLKPWKETCMKRMLSRR